MKNSRLLILGVILTTGAIFSCEKYKPLPTPDKVVSSSSATNTGSLDIIPTPYPTASGFTIIQTPKPASNLDENSPLEPNPYKTQPPYILGKEAPSFTGAPSSTSSSTPELAVVAPSKVSGKVYYYDATSKIYRVLSNATVSISGSLVTTNVSGDYSTSSEFSSLVDISASANGFYSSTVANVVPGMGRDIHLQPLDNRTQFNQNTITSEILTMNAEEPKVANLYVSPTPSVSSSGTPIPSKKYTSLLSYADNDGSRFVTNVIDPTTGRIRLELNPVATKTSTTGQLFIYDIERDSFGNPTNPTQMKKFLYKKNISFKVGDNNFPGINLNATTVTETAATTTDNNEILKKFFNINVKFHDSYGFSNFVCNAYVVFPTGEKVLVSKYAGGMPTNLAFRVPRMFDVDGCSYSIEAHAGNDTVGSDAVINDLHEGDSAEIYLLNPTNSLSPNYDSTNVGTAPTFTWNSVDQAKSYQLQVDSTDSYIGDSWEAFTASNSITYPSSLSPLKSNSQYKNQLIALDFNPGGLNILSKKTDALRYRLIKNKSGDMKFSIKLANHNTKVLPKGYRISYNTVLFRAK
ncbi:MAG: hypothetical protein U0457_17985 [Candidatus Sericytochromatia bacterium]